MKIEVAFDDLKNMNPVIFPMHAYLILLRDENRKHTEHFHGFIAEAVLTYIESEEPLNTLDVVANIINLELPQDLYVAALEVLYKNNMLCTDYLNIKALNALITIPFEYVKRIFDGFITQNITSEELDNRLNEIGNELRNQKKSN